MKIEISLESNDNRNFEKFNFKVCQVLMLKLSENSEAQINDGNLFSFNKT